MRVSKDMQNPGGIIRRGSATVSSVDQVERDSGHVGCEPDEHIVEHRVDRERGPTHVARLHNRRRDRWPHVLLVRWQQRRARHVRWRAGRARPTAHEFHQQSFGANQRSLVLREARLVGAQFLRAV